MIIKIIILCFCLQIFFSCSSLEEINEELEELISENEQKILPEIDIIDSCYIPIEEVFDREIYKNKIKEENKADLKKDNDAFKTFEELLKIVK